MEFFLQLDGNILLFIQEYFRYEWMNPFWKLITSLSNSGWLWITISVLLLFPKRTRKVGVVALTALVLGFLITNVVMKNMIQRARPHETVQGLMLLIPKPNDFSFPSGHACASFAAAFVYYRLLPKVWGISALILATLIAVSRLYVGVHYPSDILAGLLVGVFAGWVAVYVVERIYKKKSPGDVHQ